LWIVRQGIGQIADACERNAQYAEISSVLTLFPTQTQQPATAPRL
jgi:hypothetical protein